MIDSRRSITEILLVATLLLGVIYPEHPLEEVKRFLRERELEQEPVKKYSQYEIEATAPHLEVFHPRLLVWSDGEGFRVYNLDHKDTHYQDTGSCGRCAKTIPLMVNALMENFSNRFQPGQPDFQMLWSDADSFQSQCVNKGAACQPEKFSPLPLFGSVPKDPDVLPTVRGMPNWFYLNCMFNWRFQVADPRGACWNEPINERMEWEKLKSSVIWRGSDFTFLPTYHEFPFENPRRMMDFPDQFGDEDMTPETIVMKLFHHYDELSPRWKVIALSSQAQLLNETWIDAKFVGPIRDEAHEKFLARGVQVAAPERLDSFAMSSYKYQLDLGGGGGTSWRGTISKLDMPGVLLHHETPTKDWFYDRMVPFKHYIPVSVDLVDLKAKFEWAEANQDRAKEISQAATRLASSLFSEEYMTELHQELFVGYLGKVVDSYVPTNSSWSDSHRRYVNNGFKLTEVAYCRATRCFTNVRDDIWRSFPYVVSAKSSVDENQTVFGKSNVELLHKNPNIKAAPSPRAIAKSAERYLVTVEEDIEDNESPQELSDSMEEAALEQMVDAFEEVKLDTDAVSTPSADQSTTVENEILDPPPMNMVDSKTELETVVHAIESKLDEDVEGKYEEHNFVNQVKLLEKALPIREISQNIIVPIVKPEEMSDAPQALAKENAGGIHDEIPHSAMPISDHTPDLSQIINLVESDLSIDSSIESSNSEVSMLSTPLTRAKKPKHLLGDSDKENIQHQSFGKVNVVQENMSEMPGEKTASATLKADERSSHSATNSKEDTNHKLPTVVTKVETSESTQSSAVVHPQVNPNQVSKHKNTERYSSNYLEEEESGPGGLHARGSSISHTTPRLTTKKG